jgi:hypothetical protein
MTTLHSLLIVGVTADEQLQTVIKVQRHSMDHEGNPVVLSKEITALTLGTKKHLDLMRALDELSVVGLEYRMVPDIAPRLAPNHSLEAYFSGASKVWIRDMVFQHIDIKNPRNNRYKFVVSLRSRDDEKALSKFDKWLESVFEPLYRRLWGIYPLATIELGADRVQNLLNSLGRPNGTAADLENSFFVLSQSRRFYNPREALASVIY